jgi:hypothetical protein
VLVGEHPNRLLNITAVTLIYDVLCRKRFQLANHIYSSKVVLMKTRMAITALALSVLIVRTPASAQTQSLDRRTPLDEALEFYQDLSGKTVLRSPNLPTLSEFNKPVPSSDTNGMIVVLENELLKNNIEIIPLREIFVLAVEFGWTNSSAAKHIATIRPQSTPGSPSGSIVPASNDSDSGQAAIPPGTIDFKGADLRQCLDLYSMLVHRTLLLDGQLSSPTLKLRTQTPITKNGAIYVLEVALALNGIAAANDGSNFVQVVPLSRFADLKLQAPAHNPDDPLLDPENIRRIGFLPLTKPRQQGQSAPRAADELVAYYAELTGRTGVPSDRVGSVSLLFRAEISLTKPELLYALETTLALNRLKIIEVDDKTIRAGYIQEPNKAVMKSQ